MIGLNIMPNISLGDMLKTSHRRELERFSDNLPTETREEAKADRLIAALDKVEAEFKSGEVSSPHPYGGSIDLKRIQKLRYNISLASESWSMYGSQQKALGASQLSDIFKGESRDLESRISTESQARVEEHKSATRSARKHARISLVRGVAKALTMGSLQVGATLAGAIIGSAGGPPGTALGAFGMATIASTFPTLTDDPFGKSDFESAKSYRESANTPLSETDPTVERLKLEKEMFANLASDAEAWARLL